LTTHNAIEMNITLTLDEIDALIKTVAIAKDNTAKKMKDNQANPQHRAFRTAADDYQQLYSVYSKLAEAQAKALLDSDWMGEPF